MSGIEILNQYEVVVETTLNAAAFWIVFGITAALIIGIGIFLYASDSCSVGIIPAMAVVGLIVGFVCGMAFGRIAEIPIKYETRYEVQISDDVSMSEFTKKYEVIDQRGSIFIIREKTE